MAIFTVVEKNDNKILSPQRKGTYDSNLGRFGVFRVLSILYNNHSILRNEDPLMDNRNLPGKNFRHCVSCQKIRIKVLRLHRNRTKQCEWN